MSKFVIMETIDGMSQPVAIRDTQEVAQACCLTQANLRSQKPHGEVRPFEGGARFFAPEAVYTVVEVADVAADLG